MSNISPFFRSLQTKAQPGSVSAMLAGTGCHTPQTFPRGKALLTPSPLPSIIEDLSQRSLMLFMVHKPWEQLITFSFMFPEHFIFLLICFALDSILPDINHAAPVF